MRILLVGEYSRLHNSLKEGLLKDGHQVTLIGNGDYFKKFPVDIITDGKWTTSYWLLRKLRRLIYLIFRIDIAAWETLLRFKKNRKKLTDYDIVQLINERPFLTTSYTEKKLLEFIFEYNKNVFLLACGDDYIYVSYAHDGKFEFCTLTPYLKDPNLKKQYKYTLQKLGDKQKEIHEYVFKNIKGVIPVSIEYEMVYSGRSEKLPMIPNPINIDKIRFAPAPFENGKVKILHGINNDNYIKKGNALFEEALKVIQSKYPEKVTIITTRSLPYREYVKHFKSAHILLDQVYAHDQGYNALEAMAMGKVVFTGGGKPFREHYGITAKTFIETKPDVNEIITNLEWLILNPEEIFNIGKRARKFIEEHHDYKEIAQKYIQTWSKNT